MECQSKSCSEVSSAEPPLIVEESWKSEIRNSITDIKSLKEFFPNIGENDLNLPIRITPYYFGVMKNSVDLQKTMIPSMYEELNSIGEVEDPLCEDKHMVSKGLIHKYPDRALFLVTDFCSSNCRHCTRSRIFRAEEHINKDNWQPALEYIRNHTELRDIIISGGDPLTLSDENIEYLLSELRKIEHIEIIRIGTKIPVVLPQRITPELVNIIKKYHPVFMNIHFTHADEITKETSQALKLLADAGIPLGSQTVLLKGVNDSKEKIKALMHKLLINRVKPYYIYSCDRVSGTKHFWVSIKDGLEIVSSLRGYTSGLAVPQYIVDSERGKIAISVNNILREDENGIVLQSYDGKEVYFPNF